MRNMLASLVLAVFGTIAYADDNGGLVVVELFTSEGCSSCPPADKILTSLAKRKGILALGLHVDYWDYLGWKDHYSMAQFTKRQKVYNRVLGSRYRLVTPQMVFQGQSHVAGAKQAQIEDHLAKLANHSDIVTLGVEKHGAMFRVSISPRATSVLDADVFVVRYMPQHSSKIKAGENRGMTLNHANIVTSWERVGQWSGQLDWRIEHPLSQESNTHTAVIVQAANHGPILAARTLQ